MRNRTTFSDLPEFLKRRRHVSRQVRRTKTKPPWPVLPPEPEPEQAPTAQTAAAEPPASSDDEGVIFTARWPAVSDQTAEELPDPAGVAAGQCCPCCGRLIDDAHLTQRWAESRHEGNTTRFPCPHCAHQVECEMVVRLEFRLSKL